MISKCLICSISFNSEKVGHCCNCKRNFGLKTNHCCNCNLDWSKEQKIHCCNCKSNYSIESNHKCCIKCNKKWDSIKSYHCCECKYIYILDNNHCCECKMDYDKYKIHCHKCKINYNPKEKDHCCDCQDVWMVRTYNHCNDCHMIFYGNNHCCKCKKIWYHDRHFKHCSKCCVTYASNIETCDCFVENKKIELQKNCVCNLVDCHSSNSCPKYNDFIKICSDKINNFIKEYPITKDYSFSKCLRYECDSIQNFFKTIYELGFNNIIDFLNDDSNYVFMFHGTPNINYISQICCQSYSPVHRCSCGGQTDLLGCGEYFTNKFNTARKYTNENGAVILNLVINPDILKKTKYNQNIKVNKNCPDGWNEMEEENDGELKNKNMSDRECWYKGEEFYVIDNLKTNSFCVPIAIIKSFDDRIIEPYLFCHREKVKNAVYFYYNDGKNIISLEQEIITKILKCKNNNIESFILNDIKYYVNDMIMINYKQGRRIKFFIA